MNDYITTDIELQTIVGGAINGNLEYDSIAPFINEAAQEYIVPAIGSELYEDADTDHPELAACIKTALGFLALHTYTPFGVVQMSEAGMSRSESTSNKSAYKYQENNYSDSSEEIGLNAVDKAVEYCYKNRAALDWEMADIYEERFIISASEFRKIYSRQITRKTFELIVPNMEDVQEFALNRTIGPEFVDHLLSILHGTAAISTTNKKTLRLLKKCLASLTIAEAVKRNYVQLQGDKVLMYERSDSQSTQYQRTVTPAQMGVLLSSDEINGNGYLRQLLYHIEKYKDSYANYWPLTEHVPVQDSLDIPIIEGDAIIGF